MTKSQQNSILIVLIILLGAVVFLHEQAVVDVPQPVLFWEVQSLDTMKFSRDLAREKLNDPTFDETIEQQISEIAKANATHVAIGTPYDPEFLPFLKRWVSAARRHNLKIWFRGNLSGWEGWFEYPLIDREMHKQEILKFIKDNPDLFEDGDIFDSCPECENGGPGDPRQTGDVIGHRKFLIEEYKDLYSEFNRQGKKMYAVVFSMNGDVTKLVMDRETVKSLGNRIVIDHYVTTPEKLVEDTKNLGSATGARIMLGEFGAPVPDLHGELSPEDQKILVERTLRQVAQEGNILGINYWVFAGGTTELWTDSGKHEKAAAKALKTYYSPSLATGYILDDSGNPISSASISTSFAETRTDSRGKFQIPLIEPTLAKISAKNFLSDEIVLPQSGTEITIALTASDNSPIKKFFRFLRSKI
ncbi:MAG: carboxypeptidase-like regulatory domain-containing protein [Candidatus Doudnabacteria bacterium]|nr:carboxypeptidase-like regulatory domain-containing protein [Candidatus Doudnabacteria bacterium]